MRQQIERQERKNAKLADDLDVLIRRGDAIQREAGLAGLDSTRRLCERLIEFFGRKSLSEWHREELIGWIGELIERAASIEQECAAGLRQRLTTAVGKYFGMSEEQLEARRRQFEDQVRAEFEHDEGFYQQPDEDLDADNFDDGKWDEPGPGGATSGEPGFDPGSVRERSSRLTDADWLRGLFRRAARLLHPDRETDPDKREYKHGRMQELLRARKEGDVVGMLNLYADAGGHEELALEESEVAQACDLMRERLMDLQSEYREITFQSPHHLWAYETFFRLGKAKRESQFRRLERDYRQQAVEDDALVEELRNLQVLKQHLKKRRAVDADLIRDFEESFGADMRF